MQTLKNVSVAGAAMVAWLICSFAWADGGPHPAAGAGWPCWRGPSHDGQSTEVPAAMPKFKQLWKKRLAGRCDAGVTAGEGVVVVADSDGRRNDYYWCFQADTGKELWVAKVRNNRKMAYGSAPRATPCIYKGKVIVLGAFGDLHCYNLKTGKPVWEKLYRKDFGAKPKPPEWGFTTPPLIVDGKLLLLPGDLIALDPETGKLLWKTRTAGPNYAAILPATVAGKRQVIGYDAATVGGWDLAKGTRLWSAPADNSKGYIVPTPVTVGEKLLLATESESARLFGFDAAGKLQPSPLGTSKSLAPEIATPTVVGKVVLGVTNGLICLDPADKLKTLWTQDEEDAFQGMAHIVANGERAMVFGDKGEMVMIRATAQRCEILGRAKLGGGGKASVVWSHPALADGRIFLRDEKYIYAWEMLPRAGVE